MSTSISESSRIPLTEHPSIHPSVHPTSPHLSLLLHQPIHAPAGLPLRSGCHFSKPSVFAPSMHVSAVGGSSGVTLISGIGRLCSAGCLGAGMLRSPRRSSRELCQDSPDGTALQQAGRQAGWLAQREFVCGCCIDWSEMSP